MDEEFFDSLDFVVLWLSGNGGEGLDGGQPKDNDIRGVKTFLLQTCLSIRLAGSKAGKVAGLILLNAAYKNQPGVTASFNEDNAPLYKYDLEVTKDTKV